MVTSTIPQTSGIYRITCTANGKIYVGSSVDIQSRWRGHRSDLNRNIHGNKHLQGAWNKYGESSFVIEIVELVMPWSLTDREQYWIDKLQACDRRVGYNMNKLADRPPSPVGRIVSPETRQKISAAQKGRKKPLNQTEKAARLRRGRRVSPETRAKMSAAQSGKKMKPESIAKTVAARERRWLLVSPLGQSLSIINLNKFCRENGLNHSLMIAVAQKRRTHHKGWGCQYD